MKKQKETTIAKPVERLFAYPTAIGVALFSGLQAYSLLTVIGYNPGADVYYLWSSLMTSLLPLIYFGAFYVLAASGTWQQKMFKSLLITVPAGILWMAASMFSSLLYPMAIEYGSYVDLYIQGGTALVVLLAFAALLWRLRQKGQW